MNLHYAIMSTYAQKALIALYTKNLYLYDDLPNLTAYFERLKQRPSAQKILV